MTEKEMLEKKIEEVQKDIEKMNKELQNPFLSLTLREKYKKDIKVKEHELKELKKRLLLIDV